MTKRRDFLKSASHLVLSIPAFSFRHHYIAPNPPIVWPVVAKILKDLGIAIAASTVGSIVKEEVLDPIFGWGIHSEDETDKGKKGQAMREKAEQAIQEVKETVRTNGYCNFKNSPEVWKKRKPYFFGGSTSDGSDSSIALFPFLDPKSLVTLSGPSVFGYHRLIQYAQKRLAIDDYSEKARIILPNEVVVDDVVSFSKPYTTRYRTQAGTLIQFEYNTNGKGTGSIKTTVIGMESKTVSFNEDLIYDV